MTALNEALNAAANEAAADSTATAQPISQVDQGSVVGNGEATTPAVANRQVAAAPAAGGPSLSMDSSVVQSQSSITEFLKLSDGGCMVGEAKFDPIKVRIRLEDASNGGGFKPAYMMNYEGPQGMVYTKSYDGVNTSSNNPAHAGLSWADNKARILNLAPKAYDFLGYDIAFVVAEDTLSKDKKTELKAGTVLGFTTPYTAAKMLKKVWDSGVGANQRGNDAILMISGEEISKNGRQYKQLVVEHVGYAAPTTVAEPEHEGE
ncbi:hypothetical protein [Acinetobacter phage vB_AbaS_TCUP2199]|nr:hypothetical protein [Acinetobacter phage vB_AbaS_TCUP2199]